MEAAQAVDVTVAGLEERAIEEIVAGEHAYVALCWAHREEHIAQIRDTLSAA